MGTISLSLPADGQTIDASDVNNPLNTIAAEINGNLDNANIKAGAAIDRSKIAGITDGWENLGYAPSTITALGNHSYSAVIASANLTSSLSPGMRVKLPRTVTAPTGALTLNGTTQYANKTSPAGMTFTNNFVVSAWVKLSAYNGAFNIIASRMNGSSGWVLGINASGQIAVQGFNAAAGNFAQSLSYQSIPLNKWVHVSGQLDMTTTSVGGTNNYITIDGVEVPNAFSRGGTNPTALVQAGNLEIGSENGGGNPFPGEIAQVAIYSAKVTQATILASMNQTLTGSETSLISAYKLDQASGLTDLSANGNNLTAQGSPTYTADTPFTQTQTGVTAGTTNYGIVTKIVFSTNTTVTIQVPEGDTIPTGASPISAVSYSTQKVPYGFPSQAGKWTIETRIRSACTTPALSANVWATFTGVQLIEPVGEFSHYIEGGVISSAGGAMAQDLFAGLSTVSGSGHTGTTMTATFYFNAVTASSLKFPIRRTDKVSNTNQTTYYMNGKSVNVVGTTTLSIDVNAGDFVIVAENSYL